MERTWVIIRIRDKLRVMSLSLQVVLLRLKRQRIEMLKGEFLVYSLFILLVGIGLGMVWRANQFVTPLGSETTFLETSSLVAAPKGIYSVFYDH